MRRGALWSIAEFWSWVAMFILMLFAVIFFRSCSGPTLQSIQGQQLQGLAERQEALMVMRTPVVYQGQDVDLAFLISLGDVESEFDKVFPSIQSALRQRMAAASRADTLSIDYGGWKVMLAEDFNPVLDSLRLPSPSGSKIEVEVRGASKDKYDSVVRGFAKAGGWQYVSADGRVWDYWTKSPSGQSGVWSEEGFPCATRRDGKSRVCVSAPASAPSVCFIDDVSFSRQGFVDSQECASALGVGTDAGKISAVAAQKAFVCALCKTKKIGESVKAPNGVTYMFWGENCRITGPAGLVGCGFWSLRDVCSGKKVVTDPASVSETSLPWGMCEQGKSGEAELLSFYYSNKAAFVAQGDMTGDCMQCAGAS